MNHTDIIARIITLLEEKYVHPDTAADMIDHLSRQRDSGVYDAISDPHELSRCITDDLQSVSRDLHMKVICDPHEAQCLDPETPGYERPKSNTVKMARYHNFGFETVSHLPGNIGYLNLTALYPPKLAGDVPAAAMQFLAHSSALIIDLRQNGGGSPKMIQLLTSYLFDSTPVHLNTIHWRGKDDPHEFWTLTDIPGKRMPDMPCYVLIGEETYSGGEEFAYNLKQLKRATLIGKTSKGAAHPPEPVFLTPDLIMEVPVGRSVNPVTNTNWERIGVEPDIEVPAEEALHFAHQKALTTLIAESDQEWLRDFYQSALDDLNSHPRSKPE